MSTATAHSSDAATRDHGALAGVLWRAPGANVMVCGSGRSGMARNKSTIGDRVLRPHLGLGVLPGTFTIASGVRWWRWMVRGVMAAPTIPRRRFAQPRIRPNDDTRELDCNLHGENAVRSLAFMSATCRTLRGRDRGSGSSE